MQIDWESGGIGFLILSCKLETPHYIHHTIPSPKGIQCFSNAAVTAVANGNPCNIIAVNKLMAEDSFVCTPSVRPSNKLCMNIPKTKKTTVIIRHDKL